MASAGMAHTVLLRSDGNIAIAGSDDSGQCRLPLKTCRHRYQQVSAGPAHTLLLSTEGRVFAFGCSDDHKCEVPELPTRGLKYVQVSAGGTCSLALRSDGKVAFGGRKVDDDKEDKSVTGKGTAASGILSGDFSLGYQQVSAGYYHFVLLREDGVAVAFGDNSSGQCDLAEFSIGSTKRNVSSPGYVQVSAGANHTVLLTSNGHAETVGDNGEGQCEIPAPRSGVHYVCASAGASHTVLLCSDGHVEAVGCNDCGQCDIPELEDGVSYLQASAGGEHTLLLRSDDQVLALGSNHDGQCNVPPVLEKQTWMDWVNMKPALPPGVKYVMDSQEMPFTAPLPEINCPICLNEVSDEDRVPCCLQCQESKWLHRQCLLSLVLKPGHSLTEMDGDYAHIEQVCPDGEIEKVSKAEALRRLKTGETLDVSASLTCGWKGCPKNNKPYQIDLEEEGIHWKCQQTNTHICEECILKALKPLVSCPTCRELLPISKSVVTRKLGPINTEHDTFLMRNLHDYTEHLFTRSCALSTASPSRILSSPSPSRT